MRIAVIGAGVSGLWAARLLTRKHEVVLLEREPRAGGHACTVDVDDGGTTVPIDVGFIVYNERTYPLLTRLLRELGVATQESDMSFSVTCERCDIAFATTSWRTMLARARNVLKPSFWRTALEFRRFFRLARLALADPAHSQETLGDWRRRNALADDFERHFLAPMTAAIWSTDARRTGLAPAADVFRFYENHGLLAFSGRPRWRTVAGGSRRYVDRIVEGLGGVIRLGAPVERVRRESDGAVVTVGGERMRCDAVVLAVHADVAARMLDDAAPEERAALSAFAYAKNPLLLHRDRSFLPREPVARASWNYRVADCRDPEEGVPITYWMNRLQALPTATDWCVTLNAKILPRASEIAFGTTFEHPIGSAAAAGARTAIRARNGERNTWFAGAHLGFGFHEDGLRSAVEVAAGLGVPW